MIESEDQQNLYEEYTTTNNNILIGAVAGAGKTTSLLKLLELCNRKVLFLAFNKSIKEEIEFRIEEKGLKNGKALTMHGLGLLTLRKEYKRIFVKKNKKYDLLKKLEAANRASYRGMLWEDKISLNFSIMDLNDASRMFLTNNIEELKIFLHTMDKAIIINDLLLLLWESFIEIRAESYEGRNIDIDFLDMVYLPVLKNLNIPLKPHEVYIDEIQDLNKCQHALLRLLFIQPQFKKFVGVGDKNQSIYSFAGAFSDSFNMFLEYENVVEMPLRICYRCPKLIVDAANEVYDVMTPFKTEEGIVDIVEDPQNIIPNSLVICRNSGPILKLYFQLISFDKVCVIRGEDIMNSILRFLRPYMTHTVTTAKIAMTETFIEMEGKKSETERIAYYLFKENYNNFTILIKYLADNYTLIKSLIERIKKLFENKENAITLCTIHKAKGLESDVVYILNEHLIPSSFATSKEQLIQEQNLKYVARTRAKKELYYLNLK